MRKIISIVLSVIMVLSSVLCVEFSAYAQDSYVYGSGTLTKAEWLHDLAVAYEMSDESGYFENYYNDLDESHTYYNDIMLNIKYGTIDLEAGSDLQPDANVSREFAAHSINVLLGYTPTNSISFTDSDSCLFPEDDQVAVENNWISKVSDKFNPNNALTSSQAQTMINALIDIKASVEVDENYDSSWSVTSGVIEIPEETNVEIEDDTVTIKNSPKTIKAGDIFVVYQLGIGLSYTAKSVSKSGENTIIVAEEYDAEDAFGNVDAQGIIDSSEIEFYSLDEGITIEEIEQNSAQLRGLSKKASGSTKLKKRIELEGNPFNFKNVKTKGVLENAKITYNFDTKKKKMSIILDGDLSLTTTITAKASTSIPLLGFEVPGIAVAGITLDANAEGKLTSFIHTHMRVGFECTGNKTRMIQDFRELGGSYDQAEVEGKVAIAAQVSIAKNKLISGRIFAEMGFKVDHTYRVYSDGKAPKRCVTDKSCFFIQYGATASCSFLNISYDNTVKLYDYGSSPIQTFHHYEDGREVSYCSRGDDMRYYTKWNSAYWGNGIYSGLGYGLDGEGVQIPIFEYTTDSDGNATITKYNGCSSYVNIPETLDEHTVIGIGDRAFKGHNEIYSVSIPSTVTSLGNAVFENCTNLYSVNLPKNVSTHKYAGQTVYYGPFYGCSSLGNVDFASGYSYIDDAMFQNCGITSITLPSTITEIGYRVFSKCISLKNIKLNENLSIIGDYVFDSCTGLTSVNLPSSVTQLGAACFYNCTNLTTVNLPKNVNTYKYAGQTTNYGPFYGCSSLKNVEFASGYTYIDDAMFQNCGITSITLPNTVTELGYRVFHNCINLTEINLDSSLTTIGDYVFDSCTGLTSVNLPSSVTQLGAACFYNCTNLTTVNLPKNVNTYKYAGQTTNYGPFYGCSSLKNVEFANGYKYIDDAMFQNCGITSITLPSTITELGYRVFHNCSKLKSVKMNDGLEKIGNAVFESTGIESIVIPDSVVSIGGYTFQNSTNLSSVTLPKTTTTVTDYMFDGCTSLKSVELPSNVKSINQRAFSNSAIESIVLPDTVESIGFATFAHSALKNITFGGNEKTIGKQAFEDCDNLAKITIPNSVTSLGTHVFLDSDILTDVTFGTGITEIPQNAFEHCDALKKLVIPYRVTSIGSNAFLNTIAFTDITIPRATTSIASNAFSYPDKLTITGVSGTYAESYANDNGISFVNKEVPATSIELNYSELTLAKGASTVLILSVNPSDFTDAVIWKSTDDSVVAVDASGSGKITAKAVGTAKIKVNVGATSKVCNVTVVQPVTSISLNKTSLSMEALDTYQLVATPSPSSAYDKTVTWSSSDEDIATVDKNGIVKALKKGSAIITATANDGSGISKKCTVTVTNNTYEANSVSDLESPHNYENNCNDKWVYTVENATKLTVVFNQNTNIEEDFDFLYIYNKNNNQIGKFTGTELAGKSITIDGDTVKIKIVSDDSGNEWGFKVDSVTPVFPHTHIPVSDPGVPATCTETGLTEGSHCSICGEVIVAQKVIKALGHNYVGVVTSPTCTESGFTTYKCAVCGDTYTGDIVPPYHKYEISDISSATLTSNGEIIYMCSECGNTVSETINHPRTISLSKNTFTYNNKIQKPSAIVKDAYGNTISSDNYTVSYSGSLKNVGSYTVTVSFKGNYSGTKKLTYRINPKSTTVSKVTSPKSKQLKVTWKKQATQTTGYEVQYNTDKNFKSGNKTVIVNKNKTTSTTIKKLKSKKKYYVRIRTYKAIGKTKYYSSWSKAKSVKVK